MTSDLRSQNADSCSSHTAIRFGCCITFDCYIIEAAEMLRLRNL